MDVASLIDGMLEAVGAERAAVRQALGALDGRSVFPLRAGVRRVNEPGAQVYAFEGPIDVLLAEGTRVQVRAPGLASSGEVVDHDGALGRIVLVLKDDLGDDLPEATLDLDATGLLDRLAARLAAIRAANGPGAVDERGVARALGFLAGSKEPCVPERVEADGLSVSQAAAVSFAVAQEVAYVWGPPGTGKTQALARMVRVLMERGERVLLLAHTNVATDNALLRVLTDGGEARGTAVRVGVAGPSLRPYDVGLDARVDQALAVGYADEVDEMEQLCELALDRAARVPTVLASSRAPLALRFSVAAAALAVLLESRDGTTLARVAELGALVRHVEAQILSSAGLVATTLSRLSTWRTLWPHRADTVVIDEASTASLAHAFVAACHATRRVVAVGDFRQLPAIVQAEHPAARRWLGRNVFASAGCDRADTDHPLRFLLHEQWRMHPQIARVVSDVFYAGRLVDSPLVLARADAAPALLLVDTSKLGATTGRVASGSKVNAVHATLIAGLVGRIVGCGVAVIAPYRAQVRRLRDALREREPLRVAAGQIEVFTVHRFQGRDQQVVVFDMVEAPGTPCRFLSELENPEAPNLINVALSRAKTRLIVVAHLAHLTDALGRSALVNRMIAHLRQVGAVEVVAGDARDDTVLAAFFQGEERGDPGN